MKNRCAHFSITGANATGLQTQINNFFNSEPGIVLVETVFTTVNTGTPGIYLFTALIMYKGA